MKGEILRVWMRGVYPCNRTEWKMEHTGPITQSTGETQSLEFISMNTSLRFLEVLDMTDEAYFNTFC